MRFILAKANFSGEGNNIGTLNSWFVSYNKPNGITWSSIQSNVDKNATFTAMATLDSTNYEIQNVTVSMGDVSQSGAGSNGGISIEISENNIVIGIVSVTSNVNISVITKSKSSSPELPEEPETPTNYTFTLNPTPTSATVTLSATGYSTVSGTGNQSITVANGTEVNWSVSASGYTEQNGTWTANGSNETENIVLSASGNSGTTVDIADSSAYSIAGFMRPAGTISDNSSYRMTDYINIAGYSQLIVHTEPKTVTVSPAVFFDTDKNYISGFTAEDIAEQDYTIDIPDGAVYVKSSTLNATSLKNCSIKGIV